MILPRSLLYVAIGAGVAGGLYAGYAIWHPRRIVETYAPQVRQKDSSLVLERKPDATAKPAHTIPKGAKVERVVSVTVQPRPLIDSTYSPAQKPGDNPATVRPATSSDTAPANSKPASGCSCDPITVDLTLVREKNGMRRVIASSKTADVTGGVDIPVESAEPQRKLKWSVGPLWLSNEHQMLPTSMMPDGGFITRDFGPLRAIGSVFRYQLPDGKYERAGQIAIGIRF